MKRKVPILEAEIANPNGTAAAFLPVKSEPDVRVNVDLPPVRSACNNLAEFCAVMGITAIDAGQFESLHKAGDAMETLGATKLTSPMLLSTQYALFSAIKELSGDLKEEGADRVMITKCMAYAADKLSKVATTINDATPRVPAPTKRPTQKSFTPGAVVQTNIQINSPSKPPDVTAKQEKGT